MFQANCNGQMMRARGLKSLCSPRRLYFPLAMLLICAGCNNGEPTGQATGSLSWNGRPVHGAEIVFIGASDPDRVFMGSSSRDGRYQVDYRVLDGMPVGNYKVTITVYTIGDGVPFPPGERADALKDEGKLKPESFVFEKEIARGSNTIDFDLAQGKKPEPLTAP